MRVTIIVHVVDEGAIGQSTFGLSNLPSLGLSAQEAADLLVSFLAKGASEPVTDEAVTSIMSAAERIKARRRRPD